MKLTHGFGTLGSDSIKDPRQRFPSQAVENEPLLAGWSNNKIKLLGKKKKGGKKRESVNNFMPASQASGEEPTSLGYGRQTLESPYRGVDQTHTREIVPRELN